MTSHNCIMFYVPCPSKAVAADMAQTLLEQRLIGCANIMPAHTSYYVWDGAMQQEEEVVMLLKTNTSRADAAKKRIKELHPYDTPCILQIDAQANEEFAKWLNDAVS